MPHSRPLSSLMRSSTLEAGCTSVADRDDDDSGADSEHADCAFQVFTQPHPLLHRNRNSNLRETNTQILCRIHIKSRKRQAVMRRLECGSHPRQTSAGRSEYTHCHEDAFAYIPRYPTLTYKWQVKYPRVYLWRLGKAEVMALKRVSACGRSMPGIGSTTERSVLICSVKAQLEALFVFVVVGHN